MRRLTRGLFLLVAVVLVAVGVAPPPSVAQQQTLDMAILAGFKEDVLRVNVGTFERKTGIKVNFDSAPYGDLYKKILLSLGAGARRYDVLLLDEPWIPALSEFLLPLDDLIKGMDLSDVVPTTMAAGRYKGQQYALPNDPNVQIFIYRKDLFAQLGLQPPATWDQVLAAARALHDPSRDLAGIVMTAGSDLQTFAYLTLFLWSFGVEILDDNGRAAVNTPAARQAVEFYLELLKFAPAAVRSYTFADVTQTMSLGKAAMAVQWASGIRRMEDPQQSVVAGKLGYSVVPRGTRITPMRGVWLAGIAKNSLKREAAWKLVQWLNGDEFGLAASLFPTRASAFHSPRASVLRNPKVVETLPYAPTLLHTLRVAKERPRVPQWPDIQEQLRIVGARITTGEVSVAAGLRELETSINRIMGK